MLKRLLSTFITGFLAMSLNGCLVAESTYLKKVDEADVLTNNLKELQQKYSTLSTDNSALKADYEKLKGEAAAVTADKIQLEDLLKAKSDTLSKKHQ